MEELVRELEKEKRRRGLATQKDLAEAIGVSTKTLGALLKGKLLSTDMGDFSSAPMEAGDRQVRGWAESLTRVALFLGLDVSEVLESVKIDISNPGVAGAVDRVKEEDFIKRRHGDPVIDRILRRGGVKAGILVWPPFVGQDEAPNHSWGGRYMKRLLRSINPRWEVELCPIRSLKKAIDGVLGEGDDLDCCFGLYDTSSRRLRGLDFVDVPGLGVRLQVLTAAPEEVTWDDIFAGPTSGKRRLLPLVISDEVGHLFLQGVCGYSNPETVSTVEHRSLAARLAVKTALEEDESSAVIFAADSATCQALLRQYRGSDWERDLPLRLTEEEFERVRATRDRFRAVPESEGQGVAYRVGIATSADAKTWRSLLERTQKDELFRNGLSLTVTDYSRLLADESTQGMLCPLPLEPSLPPYSARLFVSRLERATTASPTVLKKWRHGWLEGSSRAYGVLRALSLLANHLDAKEVGEYIDKELLGEPLATGSEADDQ